MLDLNKMLIYYLQSCNINPTSLFVQKKVKLSMWWKKYQLPSNEFSGGSCQALWDREGKIWPWGKFELWWLGEHYDFTSIPKMGPQACIQVMTDIIHHSKKIKMNIHKAVPLCNMEYINNFVYGIKIIIKKKRCI